jgi:hypothetical protein
MPKMRQKTLLRTRKRQHQSRQLQTPKIKLINPSRT